MALTRRKDAISRRRRRTDEEGDEEGSQAGEVEDDSLSEGTVSSNGDDEVDAGTSDISEEEPVEQPHDESLSKTKSIAEVSQGPPSNAHKTTNLADPTVETRAMMNGLTINPESENTQEIHFDDSIPESSTALPTAAEAPPKVESFHETLVEKNRRDHEAYIKERRENPAFVPTRGGFFLHDNRANPAANGFRPPFRGRGRGRGQFSGAGVNRPVIEPTSLQWSHDLHETIAQPSTSSMNSASLPAKPPTVPSTNSPRPQRREFSTTTVLGTVQVVVNMPGMKNGRVIQQMAKKQRTLLPNHRPPLRRDKPVRVSIPDALPRYIFPAVERSFIFIPRGMRPNQQSYSRGRGRGSFHGSRRTSVYGSTYTPSVAMSRRSSMGRGFMGEELHSPGGSVLPRGIMGPLEVSKPVVRLPPSVQNIPNMELAAGPPAATVPVAPMLISPPPFISPRAAAIRESQPNAIPMHQPSPRKTVSVADIEAPGGVAFNPPLQQTEQPFHQQVPAQVNGNAFAEDSSQYLPHSRHPSHPSQPSGTPLSHIPERAIHAQPFQPFPLPPPGYFSYPSHPPGTVYYPGSSAELPGYNPGAAPPFIPQNATVPYMVPTAPAPAPPANDPSSGQMVAHESNGMVYYYDPSQMQSAPGFSYPVAPTGGVIGMGGMMTPPGSIYYPPAPGGVYYGPQ